jgi:hypothetical protein
VDLPAVDLPAVDLPDNNTTNSSLLSIFPTHLAAD